MTRIPINYDNTIIYKLCCKDPIITDIYIGHTTHFIKRKRVHKSDCNNIKGIRYNVYVYRFIRNNGGIDNWDMVEINKLKCIDIRDAERVEREYFDLLKPTLNKNKPILYEGEIKEYHKEYKKDNIDKIKDYNKDYYKDKQYYEQHKEKMINQASKYYYNNKEKISLKNKKNYELIKNKKLEVINI